MTTSPKYLSLWNTVRVEFVDNSCHYIIQARAETPTCDDSRSNLMKEKFQMYTSRKIQCDIAMKDKNSNK